MPDPAVDHRQAIAARNVEAILDGTEALLEHGDQVSIAGVAARSGVSRVTVYAHFSTLEELLEAVVERVVTRSTTAIDAARAGSGGVLEELDRVIAAAWGELHRNSAVAEAPPHA